MCNSHGVPGVMSQTIDRLNAEIDRLRYNRRIEIVTKKKCDGKAHWCPKHHVWHK
jgi:hypothetical protein